MTNNPVTEDELKAKATGRRVTLADIEASIASESYFRAGQAADNAARQGQTKIVELDSFNALQCLTFCVLVLNNGFTVTGQSACADPSNYNQEIGQRLAREDAVKKIWPLMGFALREEMHKEQELLNGRLFAQKDGFEVYVGTKVIHAIPMSRAIYNDFRGWTMPEDEGDDEGYLVEYTDRRETTPQKDTGFSGYLSWSPKDVFEGSYRAVGQVAPKAPATPATWGDRLKAEFQEVHDRLQKLEIFIAEDKFQDLESEDRDLLIEQYRHMVGYHRVLSERVGRAHSLTIPQPH